MKGRISLFVTVVLILIAVTQVWGSTTLICKDGVNGYTGTRDSWIHKALNGRNWGAAPTLWIRYEDPGTVTRGRIVIKFTGLNLPPEALDVDNHLLVKLRLYAKVWETEGDYISAYGLLKDFNEGVGTGPPDWSADGVLWEYATGPAIILHRLRLLGARLASAPPARRMTQREPAVRTVLLLPMTG